MFSYFLFLVLVVLFALFCSTQNFARGNRETVAELLLEFFRYYSWQFDFRHEVVSIRQPTTTAAMRKLDKAETDGWQQSDILRYTQPTTTTIIQFFLKHGTVDAAAASFSEMDTS
jgi:hypothetical protein